jgi:hypothetical protein
LASHEFLGILHRSSAVRLSSEPQVVSEETGVR